MSNDLVSRSELRKKLQARYDNGEEKFDRGYNLGIAAAIELLDSTPTVEYTFDEAFQKTVCENKLYCPARPRGEWVEGYHAGFTTHDCSICGHIKESTHLQYNFCPNCGADMRGDES